MKAFIAFRYPNEQSKYLEDLPSGVDIFDFINFSGEHYYIKGNLTDYNNQLKGLTSIGDESNYLATKEEFLHATKKIHQYIQNGICHKIVLSRVTSESVGYIELDQLFQELISTYQKELVYVAYINNQIWCGATPELFAKIDNDLISTVALASTKLLNENRSWTAKEIQEHHYIQTFYLQLAKDLNIEIIHQSEPADIITGHLVHIQSKFVFKVPIEMREEFLKRLHPTPAVGGLPQLKAIALISELEKHDRRFYTGYLGLSSHGTTTYYVNLRCMQLDSNQALLYVGGGQTMDSNGESEWQETEQKAKSMKRILIQIAEKKLR